LQKLLESGVMEKLRRETMKYEPRKTDIPVKGIELVDILPIFSILAAGISVALLLFFTEQLFAWLHHGKHQNNVQTN
jgi:hypothetical protein